MITPSTTGQVVSFGELHNLSFLLMLLRDLFDRPWLAYIGHSPCEYAVEDKVDTLVL